MFFDKDFPVSFFISFGVYILNTSVLVDTSEGMCDY